MAWSSFRQIGLRLKSQTNQKIKAFKTFGAFKRLSGITDILRSHWCSFWIFSPASVWMPFQQWSRPKSFRSSKITFRCFVQNRLSLAFILAPFLDCAHFSAASRWHFVILLQPFRPNCIIISNCGWPFPVPYYSMPWSVLLGILS